MTIIIFVTVKTVHTTSINNFAHLSLDSAKRQQLKTPNISYITQLSWLVQKICI